MKMVNGSRLYETGRFAWRQRPVTFTYDASGNLTNENRGGVQTSYSYDNENRLAVQTDPDGSKTTMTYQPDGLRRTRRTPSVLTTFVWDGTDYLQERS